MKCSGTCCFFANESREQLEQEQYSLADVRILKELGFDVHVATRFRDIPYGCDLYFSWWASGSILTLIKASLSRKPVLVVAGGQEAMLTVDSMTGIRYGYLATPWYKKMATHLCLRFATRVLVVSHHMVSDTKQLGAKALTVVHNCVDTDRFTARQADRSFVTIMFGTHANAAGMILKRAALFLHAIPAVLERFPDQKFMIIGERGDAYAWARELADTLGIGHALEFVGRVSNHAIPEYLNRSRLYVQISDSESFGVAIVEAMACQTPVVVSRKGAIPEVVGDVGVYVDNNDPAAVAAGIIQALSQTEAESQRTGSRARQRVIEHFSYERRKEAIQKVIADL